MKIYLEWPITIISPVPSTYVYNLYTYSYIDSAPNIKLKIYGWYKLPHTPLTNIAPPKLIQPWNVLFILDFIELDDILLVAAIIFRTLFVFAVTWVAAPVEEAEERGWSPDLLKTAIKESETRGTSLLLMKFKLYSSV